MGHRDGPDKMCCVLAHRAPSFLDGGSELVLVNGKMIKTVLLDRI